jgi:hypothetical protein
MHHLVKRLRYDIRSAAVNLRGHHGHYPATRENSETIGPFIADRKDASALADRN